MWKLRITEAEGDWNTMWSGIEMKCGAATRRCCLIVFWTAFFAALAMPDANWAGTTGKIAGKVVDQETGEPLPGVNVLVEGTTLGAATDLQGNFIILRVPPGVYSVRASMIGYTDFRYDNVQVSIDRTTRLEFRLRQTVLEVGETVTVTAQRPLIQMDLTSTSASVSSEVISKLPVERFQDVVNLQAGVVEGHFRGGRIGEVTYMIDGIPVNDVFSGNFAVEVENNAIQELEIISGTFSAEYGQAMSGVVNIVTKEGGETYAGELSSYFGDYISTREDLFVNIDKLNPIYNFQGSLGGPVPGLRGRTSFFVSGRAYFNDGHLYGRDIFVPSDASNFSAEDPAAWSVQSHGQRFIYSDALADSLKTNAEAVPMNPQRRKTLQAKVTYRFSPVDKLDYEILIQNQQFRQYDHLFQYNPEGDYRRFQSGMTNSFFWNHVLSSRSFFTVKFSNFLTRFKQYVYEDPFDPRYAPRARLQDASNNAFRTGGNQMWQFRRETRTNLLKVDFTSQVTNTHQFKTGVDVRLHRLWLDEFEVVLESPTRRAPATSFNNNSYTRRPMEFSWYLQDKMEFDYMIVNAGVRFDYFRPDGLIPLDFRNPTTSSKRKASISSQWSPRFGIAYPITDRGVIHVSYGHFFQVPVFDFLYRNPQFEIFPIQGTVSPPPNSLLNTVGNAELRPQKTVIYEVGLQQQLGEDLALDITAFLKDIRNLLGTQILKTAQQDIYARYVNRDYGQVKGITVALERRYVQGFSAKIDYTFMVARGNASDPNDEFLNRTAGIETTKRLIPLDWDRTHSLNVTVTAGDPRNFTIGFVGRLGSGLPYTPTRQRIRSALENSGRKPPFYNVDLYATKNFSIAGLEWSFFFRVFNLTDRLNEVEVFSDTGRAGNTLAIFESGRPRGINTVEEFFKRPDFYSAPRQVQAGMSIRF
jgi:outer membrane receptor protein involved in Fe transport